MIDKQIGWVVEHNGVILRSTQKPTKGEAVFYCGRFYPWLLSEREQRRLARYKRGFYSDVRLRRVYVKEGE